ncbi:30S ribosomal protein S12 methylthiotransferase RimO [Truepera radiovictrix]|uniref:Ribosomal protein uS12 methylthiotransferase RimO n=1 Tax=Truepera radiovictrix (strain DSM 17093 / CIP 108686 / LMG 22925 / RQ-24) TaxID=649638 RepID=D7CQZ0_TRURR|nr:30S ribosomal protein S12 methylthiotransferase RimO [Truepera radiovictrix]ADI15124.1 MiaB-like tRNA modifying enzyme YliG [Truepera radiovictrix DSM 17093]WMT56323.1 30S ribosomal protein S12 methylthiotransferase RimO [Truepera radiovictrix]
MSGKVGFVSLGCPKALVDSERILTQLRAEGYRVVPSYDEAEVVVVNTCGFITPAVEESLNAIGEALAHTGKVIVTGCLGERPEKIMARHPSVLAVTGQADVAGVMAAVHRVLPPDDNPFTSLVPPQGVKLTPRHYSYLKIAEGCNHKCAFCIIPQLRGLQVSRDAGEVLYEAYRLVASGTKELLVIAQDSSAYGVDLRHRESAFQGRQVAAHLVPLVRELSDMGAWVRLHYVYPYPHVRELIPLMAEGKLLPYLDVPLQHASPKVLRAMRRPGGAESHLKTIRAWRAVCPELAIRSTFIVGFPGETEEDFEQLLDFLQEARLERVGAFTYSEVPGAVANGFPDQVPEAVKQERFDRLMAVQQRISLEKNQAKVGRVLEVIVDDYGELPGEVVGRTKADAPGIDGTVLATGDGTTKIGDIVRVKVTGATAYDLSGEVVSQVPWRPNVLTLA